jgi:hypothetical protein
MSELTLVCGLNYHLHPGSNDDLIQPFVFIDDGLNDPIFLELAKSLQQAMPRIMKGHDLRYLWAYKYDSEWSSGINLHADQAGK